MKRTEKSMANSRQKSIANSRQGKPKGYDRDKAKCEANYEEKHSTEQKLQSASPEASEDRCRCPGGAMGAEA